jgi:hypothetical protein
MTKETTERTPGSASPARRPYQKPAFRFERVFETMALSCGKVSPTQGGCVHNRQAS